MRSRLDPRRSFRPLLEALESRALLSVCTVDRLTDLDDGKAGRGDLRYCIIESLFRADTINFEVVGAINLTRALPNLTRSVSIEGPGADLLTVRRDTGGAYRLITVAAGATVSISGLIITNGNSSNGGGILNSGTLTISDSTISGNTNVGGEGGGAILNSGTLTLNNSIIIANTGGGGGGGGIYNNNGTLTVNNSAISGNTGSAGAGGGIFNNLGLLTVNNSTISGNSAGSGGGILNSGTLTVSNSTISGNSAGLGGGGIYNIGRLTLSNSTIAGNSVTDRGGGIWVTGTMFARNTIIAGNTAPAGPDVFGNLGSQGYNLLGNPQDASGWVGTDILHVNPRLALKWTPLSRPKKCFP